MSDSPDLLLGIDIGTSAIKAVVTDAAGTSVVRSSSTSTPWRTRGGATVLDPEELTGSVLVVASELADGLPGRVAGLGVTGFAESGVWLRPDGRPLAPILPWYDDRGAEAEADLCTHFAPEEFGRRTGQVLSRRRTLVKLRWLRDQLGGGVASREARWLTVPEWVVLQLGGRPYPELSLWSRTGLLRISEPRLDPELAEWAGLSIGQQLAPARAGQPAGTVSAGLAVPGPLKGVTLTIAGHDHVCAAFGAGVFQDTVLFDSWGGGEALVRAQRSIPDPSSALARSLTVSWHVAEGRWALLRGLGTGLVLHRVLRLLGCAAEGRSELDRLAVQLHDIGGLRVEINERGGVDVLDIPNDASPEALWRAALETAFQRVLAAIETIEGGWGPLESVIGCGGWLRSRPVAALKAERVPRFLATSLDEPAAVGAAMLGGIAAGAVASGAEGGPGKSDRGG